MLRYEDLDNIVAKNLIDPVPAYESWIECSSLQDLVAIQYNHNSIHMEALTIRERILGTQCPELAHSVVFRGAVCADNGRFDRCIALWQHALELRQKNQISVQRDLLRFAQLFSQMIHVETQLKINSVTDVLNATIIELERNKSRMINPGPKDDVEIIQEEYETNIFTGYAVFNNSNWLCHSKELVNLCRLYLLTIITKLMRDTRVKITKDNLKEIYRMVFRLNKLKLTLRDGQSLLHLAVNAASPVDDFHTSDVCK